jgi:DNA-binding transcriptional MerR regulator
MARLAGLSRATLLYYDRIGLLRSDDRSAVGYRLYGAASQRRLARLLELRQAGLPLDQIARVLDGAGPQAILERQLAEIGQAEASLARQKAVLQKLIGTSLPKAALTRQDWTQLFAGIGLSEAQMWAWHHDFEIRAPEAHAVFLAGLGIPPAEVTCIRQRAASNL